MNKLTGLSVAIPYSLPTRRASQTAYVETDAETVDSARKVAAGLASYGAGPRLMPISEHGLESLKGIRADLIINLIEWTGLDLPLARQALELIDSLGIPYTGTDPA